MQQNKTRLNWLRSEGPDADGEADEDPDILPVGVLLVPSLGEHLENAVEPDTAPSAKKRKSSPVESDHQANKLEVEPDSTHPKCSVTQPSNCATMGGKRS